MIDPIKLCMGCMEERSSEPVCQRCGYKEGDPESPLHLRCRTELHGQYVAGRVLGHSDYAVTYLAWDLNLARKTIVKEYLPRALATRMQASLEVIPTSPETRKDFEWGLERFLDEALSLTRFQNHPAIISVVNFLRANGTAYMVSEYLEGATFERFLEVQGGRTNIDNVLLIMNPVLEALGAVHQAGILHRDIHPENVFITRSKQMKLMNFAGARYALALRTNNLLAFLKDGFAPFDLYDPKANQGPWTDVYLCAATMYRALTGRIPPPASERRRLDEIVSLIEMNVAISTPQQQAILKALAVRPEDRFPNMQAFQEGLAGIATTQVPAPVAQPQFRESVPFRDLSEPARPVSQTPKPIPAATPTKVPTAAPAPPAPRTALPQPAPPSTTTKPAVPIWVYAALAGVLIAGIGVAGYLIWGGKPSQQQAQEEARRKQMEEEQRKKRESSPPIETATIPPADPGQNPPGQTAATPAPSPTSPPQQAAQPKSQPVASAAGKGRRKGTKGESAPKQDSYEDLMGAGHTAARNRENQAALDNYLKAASIDDSRPQAFASAGWMYLYSFGDLPNVLTNYRRALQLGGMVHFRVQHDHGNLTFEQTCSGDFGFSRDRVNYTDDRGAHSFTATRDQVQPLQQNRASTNQLFGDFRVRLADGRTFNLISITKPKPIGDLILQLFN